MSVVVLGSINVDFVLRTPYLPRTGETVRATSFQQALGGKGANQAVAAARSGAAVTMIGRVGDDEFGSRLTADLAAFGVDTAAVSADPAAPTGTALITVDERAENTIVTHGGANHRVGEVELEALGRALEGAAVLLVQLEIPMAAVETAVNAARQAGVTVILDPAPVREIPSAVLRALDWLVCNANEAEVLGGNQEPDSLLALGPRRAVVTLGPRGCHYAGPDGLLAIPAPRVKAVDTVGAGDAFKGCLAASLASGADIETCMQRACAAGAVATTKPGAAASMPTAAQIDEAMGAGHSD